MRTLLQHAATRARVLHVASKATRRAFCGALLAVGSLAWAQPPRSACVACHGDAELFDAESIAAIVGGYADDVHAEVGLSCHDCHGGNPDPSLAEDMEASMSEAHAPNPYRGVPERIEVPGFCGRCHSDPDVMKRYRPAARVDQEREYWTSHHGRAMRAGNERAATCTDCHGVHGILRANDAASSVYPTQVAPTCNTCHGNADTMRGATKPNGQPVSLDAFARWQQSVHAQAMHEKGDLSAPTCNDCHGNHGATPPGLDSVAFVCGQCHGREATLFRGSEKHAGLLRHNEYLEDAGADGCKACHDASEPAYHVENVDSFSECSTCHGNHSINRPTVALLGPLPATPCAFCHEPLARDLIPEPASSQENYSQVLADLFQRPEAQALEGEELFDWLVDRALELPQHSLLESAVDGAPPLRPEFKRLFEKFRIGKIHYTFTDPTTGQLVRDRVTRCTDCHAAEPAVAENAVGLKVATAHLEAMQELTATTARAERMLLRARRGGVEVRDVLLDIDQAIDAQIELEVLVHEFSSAPETKFDEKHRAGVEFARSALAGAQHALEELQTRRRGLGLSLVFVVLVLIGLALVIRRTPA